MRTCMTRSLRVTFAAMAVALIGLSAGTPMAVANDECGDSSYSYTAYVGGTPARWANRSYTYLVNQQSLLPFTGANGSPQQFNEAVRYGPADWSQNRNDCGITYNANFTILYGGETTITANAAYPYGDRVNVIDFGPITQIGAPSSALAANLIYYDRTSPLTAYIYETDTRFSQTASGAHWWGKVCCGPPSTAYDVWAVSSHEAGHSIGLGHAGTTAHLTMYSGTPIADTNKRLLGRGDYLGMRNLYPFTQ